jgi:hypothetical protein
MPTPGQVFDSLEEYTLPFNLLQCFDAFRLRTIYHIEEICPPDRMGRIRACLDTLAENRSGADLGQLFDPYRDRLDLLKSMPTGVEISLPPMPAVIVRTFPDTPLAKLVDNEMKRVEQSTRVLDDEDAAVIGQITASAFGSYELPRSHAANLHYVTANVSCKVAQYLRDHPGPWTEMPLVTMSFPDMVALQRKRILKAEIDPAFRKEELDCFTDEEIRSFGSSQQATYASPRCRHFMICPRCFVRLMRWQNSMSDFLGDSEGDPIY